MRTPSFLTDSWNDIEKFFGLDGKTTANTTGMTPSQARAASTGATLANAGLLTSLFGAANSAVGGYFAAKTQQYQIESAASSAQFQSNMDAINSREAELSAQSIQEAGKTQVQQYTMRAAQENSSQQVATAARGIDLSSDSAVQQRASDALVKDIDVLTINANATRAAWSQRQQATNYSNDSLLARTSSENLRSSASTISPVFSATSSLVSSATSIGSQWDWRRRLQLATAGGS